MNKVLIAPSILSADFSRLKKDIEAVEKAGAEWLHIDVMDGSFVPNLTVGPAVVKSIRPHTKLFFDVHLMIERPDIYWKPFASSGAQLITLHVESKVNHRKLIGEIKRAGLKAGITLRPGTPVSKIVPFLPQLDLVLVMSVEPGFGGQAFMHDMVQRIESLNRLIIQRKLKCRLQVDGGINPSTAAIAVRAGADVLVAGNSIFGGKNPGRALRCLRTAIDKTSINKYNK